MGDALMLVLAVACTFALPVGIYLLALRPTRGTGEDEVVRWR